MSGIAQIKKKKQYQKQVSYAVSLTLTVILTVILPGKLALGL